MNRPYALGLFGLILAGCHGSAPRDDVYPAFFRAWEGTPAALRTELEQSRSALVMAEQQPAAFLDYARATSGLARWQADRWLEHVRTTSARPAAAQRRRVLEAAQHALSLYRQQELAGNPLGWRDRAEMAWLYVLSDLDEQAEIALALALEDPAPSEDERALLLEVHAALREHAATRPEPGKGTGP